MVDKEEFINRYLEKIYRGIEERELLRYRRDNGMAGRVIVSKFKSKCALCDEWIEAGVEVYWDKDVEDPKKRITHKVCPVIAELKAKPFKDPYPKEPKVQSEDLPF